MLHIDKNPRWIQVGVLFIGKRKSDTNKVEILLIFHFPTNFGFCCYR